MSFFGELEEIHFHKWFYGKLKLDELGVMYHTSEEAEKKLKFLEKFKSLIF
jgi:hypothetical protein